MVEFALMNKPTESGDASPQQYGTIDLTPLKVIDWARRNILHGGLKVDRLVTRDAEILLESRLFGAIFPAALVQKNRSFIFDALYALGDFSGAARVPGLSWFSGKAFTVIASTPCLKVDDILAEMNPTNIATLHENAFSSDEDTQRLLHFLKFRNSDAAAQFGLALELRGVTGSALPRLDQLAQNVDRCSRDVATTLEPLDLNTALQGALARHYSPMLTSSFFGVTSAVGPSDMPICVCISERGGDSCPIALFEYDDGNHERPLPSHVTRYALHARMRT